MEKLICTALQLTALFLLISFPAESIQQRLERSIDPELQREIDDYVQNVYLPSAKVSTLGLGIYQEGSEGQNEILYTTGYGFANKEKGILAGNDTQFMIGSLSKSFTALALVKLLHQRWPDDEERVLDKPIKELFSNLNFTLNDRFRSEFVTVRDILGHRVCIPTNDLTLITDRLSSKEEITYRTRYTNEDCGFRTSFVYNNEMFVVAGELIEALANKTYDEVISDLFAELGMNGSAIGSRTDDYENGLDNRARPYYVKDNETFPGNPELMKRIVRANPAGGIFSTPNDMIKYLRFQVNNVNTEGVLGWSFHPSMLTSFNPLTSFKQSEGEEDLRSLRFAYGLGWGLDSLGGYQYINHNGHFPPFVSRAGLFPAKKIAIFSNINMEPEKFSQETLHAFIFQTLLKKENAKEVATKFAAQLKAEDDEILKKLKESNSSEKFLQKMKNFAKKNKKASIVGSYGSGRSGNFEITKRLNEENATQYFIEYGPWYQGWLEGWGDDEGVIYRVNFTTDIIQDVYAAGEKESVDYLAFDQLNTVRLFQIYSFGVVNEWGSFERGQGGLDQLPDIPWAEGSCGPEKNTKLLTIN